jgi:uncharacterized repeat protein (TIGR02543 family)
VKKWVFLLVALLLLLSPLMGGCGAKKYKLTISVSPSGGGTTVPAAGIDKYKKDTVVTITATAATGYQFVNWTGDASGTTATATVTMTQDKSVGANFSKIQYTLTMAVVGNGTTDPAVGAHTYDTGTVVNITASPATGSQFDNWSGDATGTNATISVTMSANKTVTAIFVQQTIEYTMPPGWISDSSVSYSKALNTGDTVSGFVELTGTYHSTDWSYTWCRPSATMGHKKG